jgi:hypothetical protein
MTITRFILFSFLVASVFGSGCSCEMFANHTDPIPGWQIEFKREPGQAIKKDTQDYISKLPAEDRKYIAYQEWFTDGKGQHAIKITIGLNGTNWRHVLIYDKDDKRIKAVKYISGHSQS